MDYTKFLDISYLQVQLQQQQQVHQVQTSQQQPDDSGDHDDHEMETMETEDKKPLTNQNADVPDATQAVEVMTVVEQAANS